MPNTVNMADMTWVEVRSAIERGYTIAIVPTGGIEQNGPHMVLGKHNFIVQKTTNRIAHELGNALVAPVVSYVPEGNYDPPNGNMLFPGTLGVPETAFVAVLEGIARSLKSAGFKTICFIGDHGGSQAAQAAVALKLSHEWADQNMTVLHVADYYNVEKPQTEYLREKGETPTTIGGHAGIMDTSELLAVYPQGVDLARLKSVPLHSEPTGDWVTRRAHPPNTVGLCSRLRFVLLSSKSGQRRRREALRIREHVTAALHSTFKKADEAAYARL